MHFCSHCWNRISVIVSNEFTSPLSFEHGHNWTTEISRLSRRSSWGTYLSFPHGWIQIEQHCLSSLSRSVRVSRILRNTEIEVRKSTDSSITNDFVQRFLSKGFQAILPTSPRVLTPLLDTRACQLRSFTRSEEALLTEVVPQIPLFSDSKLDSFPSTNLLR